MSLQKREVNDFALKIGALKIGVCASSHEDDERSVDMSDDNPIRFEVKDGIATVMIDRPERKNALSWKAMEGLTDAWERAERDPAVRVIVLTSADCGVFCAGMDLKQAAEVRAN